MELTFEKVIKLVRKKLAMVIAITLICSVLAFLLSAFVISPQYTSEMKFKIRVEQSTLVDDARIAALITDVIERIKSDEFYALAKTYSLDVYTEKQIQEMISFSPVEGTTVFWMNVTASSAENALMLAQAVESAAIECISGKDELYKVESLVGPKLPQSPSSPKKLQNTAVGFVLGAAISIGLVIAIEFFDRRVKSSEDIVERYGLPILGTVPYFESAKGKGKK